jgi:NAD(P)-dependent dehydrogenase (short-subunit alcohol dehydrogenase family)
LAEQPLRGKTALVSGAASPIGMGRSMALALAAAGARVALMDVDGVALNERADEARQAGGGDCVLTIVGDVSAPADCQTAVQRTVGELGGLDVLVNNAGIQLRRTHSTDVPWHAEFWETAPEQWNHLIGINLNGQFYMARAAAPHMLAKRWGRIIGVTTSHSAMVAKGNSPYGPSKAGHEALVAIMAADLEGTGVTANVLVPGGGVDTNLAPPGVDRRGWLDPAVMLAPLLWLASEQSDGVNGRRFIARDWDDNLPLPDRLARASAAAGWPTALMHVAGG